MKMVVKTRARENFRGAANATVGDLQAALYMVAEEIMTDAKQNYVPVDTGVLRDSGFVNRSTVTAGRVLVTLGFGGAARSYALLVHERPDTIGQGKNKYLSKPVNAKAPAIPRRLGQFIQYRLARRGVI